MTIDLSRLEKQNRLLLEVPLRPVQGNRFQPTGFPDLGAATYQAGDTACLLVESAQSMANRLEETIWDEGKKRHVAAVDGISYVVVNDDSDNFLTASTLEAHRLNSAYIEKSEGDFFSSDLSQHIGVNKNRPVNKERLHKALFKYDVNSLLHGIFLESLDGRIRVARALSAFVEAEQVQIAASGGVKNDHVQPAGETGRAAQGFGNVPFHREEFTSEKITAYFSLDLQQIRSYGLGDDAERMLILLALYKIRSLLDGSLRFRTACDLEVIHPDSITARKPEGFPLPSLKDLKSDLAAAIGKCKSMMTVTTVTYTK